VNQFEPKGEKLTKEHSSVTKANNMRCPTCKEYSGSPMRGIVWPIAVHGDTTRAWVRKCSQCKVFSSSRDAAKTLCELYPHLSWCEEKDIKVCEGEYYISRYSFADARLEARELRELRCAKIKP